MNYRSMDLDVQISVCKGEYPTIKDGWNPSIIKDIFQSCYTG